METDLPRLLRAARLRAGLSQRALAARAGTTQSVVARIELGEVSPTWGTLVKLLAAAGFRLDAHLAELPVLDTHMLDDVPRILALTPEQRLAEVRNADRFLKAVRRA
jgi:transcriptional regulator with XRE-family HTH domain